MTGVIVSCGLCNSNIPVDEQGRFLCRSCPSVDLGSLITQITQARSALSDALDYSIYDLEDRRTEMWNGDVAYPQWGYFVDEWSYSDQGLHSFKRDGLTFIEVLMCTGDKALAVFSDANIEEHEEC